MKILSGVLILVTAFLSIKHGWEGLTIKPGEANLVTELGFGKTVVTIISILSLAVGLLVLFPSTFFAGNLVNAIIILSIMSLSLKAGNIKTALIEIPFLLMALVMIYLGHPFRK
ncbi:MAG: hypothetical protein HY015_09875 [Bacteroidetes bacterium]|nr:hypothetical protein [Bacteroidota bacterium]MBI3483261.1 hypothetical protein [Bacteroidota bacterium]